MPVFFRTSMLVVLTAALLLVCAGTAHAEDPAADFQTNCSSCHTIGGGTLQGPDLKDLLQRQKRDWLKKFITDPGGMIDSGDPYALKLLARAKGVRMPNVAGMSAGRADLLISLIEDESKRIDAGEKPRFAGVSIPMRPFTPEDVALGQEIFNGQQSLAEGGAACISCHTIGGIGGLGGGRLGPDLTKVFERYEDRKKLGAWLTKPATPTMLPTFRGHDMDVDTEILPLIAYFEHAAKHEQEEDTIGGFVFLVLGVFGALVFLIVAGRLWNFRFRGVRRSLVERSTWKNRADAANAATDA